MRAVKAGRTHIMMTHFVSFITENCRETGCYIYQISGLSNDGHTTNNLNLSTEIIRRKI